MGLRGFDSKSWFEKQCHHHVSKRLEMDRRHIVRGTIVFALCTLLLPLGGCVPGAIVEWTIAPDHMVPAPAQDLERLRRLLGTLGYVKADAGSRSELGAEFFSFAASQRFDVALLPDKNGAIRLKLVEHGEKKLSSIGRQQAALIADGLGAEFGYDRVLQTQGPV
jgi:hypothetical protein